jgi:TRAP-type C4-dicarboxylate transport system substrate-binding protein
MKHTLICAAAIAMATSATAQNWDMPTPYGDATFHTQNIMQFADDVRTATDGDLDITIHSAGSLFPHSEIKSAVRNRSVPIGEFFLSTLSNEDLAFGMDSQPFVATSYEDAAKLWDAQRPVIAELLAEQGLMPLFSVPWPAQGLYTNGEIATVEDLNGLRFRAYNAALEEFATLAGAAPVQIEASDIPQAFATGQVAAMITSPSTGVNSTAWDFRRSGCGRNRTDPRLGHVRDGGHKHDSRPRRERYHGLRTKRRTGRRPASHRCHDAGKLERERVR